MLLVLKMNGKQILANRAKLLIFNDEIACNFTKRPNDNPIKFPKVIIMEITADDKNAVEKVEFFNGDVDNYREHIPLLGLKKDCLTNTIAGEYSDACLALLPVLDADGKEVSYDFNYVFDDINFVFHVYRREKSLPPRLALVIHSEALYRL